MQKSMHPEDQMGEDDFELIDVQPTNEDWLLQGETIQQRGNQYQQYLTA